MCYCNYSYSSLEEILERKLSLSVSCTDIFLKSNGIVYILLKTVAICNELDRQD